MAYPQMNRMTSTELLKQGSKFGSESNLGRITFYLFFFFLIFIYLSVLGFCCSVQAL